MAGSARPAALVEAKPGNSLPMSATSAIATIASAIPSRIRGAASRVTVDATRKNAPA